MLTLEPSAGPTLDPHNLDRDEVARMRKQGSARAGHGENPSARKKSAAAKKGKIDHDMSVFVKNVPFDVSEETLRALFAEQIGAVAQAKLVMRPGTGKSRGFGYVEFVAQGAHCAAVFATHPVLTPAPAQSTWARRLRGRSWRRGTGQGR